MINVEVCNSIAMSILFLPAAFFIKGSAPRLSTVLIVKAC
jgi:hypothetical protein